MYTAMIWQNIDAAIELYLIPGDRSRFDNIWIGICYDDPKDTVLAAELSSILWDDTGNRYFQQVSKDEFVAAIRDGANLIFYGIA